MKHLLYTWNYFREQLTKNKKGRQQIKKIHMLTGDTKKNKVESEKKEKGKLFHPR